MDVLSTSQLLCIEICLGAFFRSLGRLFSNVTHFIKLGERQMDAGGFKTMGLTFHASQIVDNLNVSRIEHLGRIGARYFDVNASVIEKEHGLS